MGDDVAPTCALDDERGALEHHATAGDQGHPTGCGCGFVVWVIVTEQLMRLLQSKGMKGTMNRTLQLQSLVSFGLLQLSKAQDEPAGGRGARTAV